MDLYIYYHVRNEDAARLQPQVRSMQRELAGSFGVRGALKRRRGLQGGRQTWMEVYTDVPEDFRPALDEAAQALSLIDGERHVETFEDLPPCA